MRARFRGRVGLGSKALAVIGSIRGPFDPRAMDQFARASVPAIGGGCVNSRVAARKTFA